MGKREEGKWPVVHILYHGWNRDLAIQTNIYGMEESFGSRKGPAGRGAKRG